MQKLMFATDFQRFDVFFCKYFLGCEEDYLSIEEARKAIDIFQLVSDSNYMDFYEIMDKYCGTQNEYTLERLRLNRKIEQLLDVFVDNKLFEKKEKEEFNEITKKTKQRIYYKKKKNFDIFSIKREIFKDTLEIFDNITSQFYQEFQKDDIFLDIDKIQKEPSKIKEYLKNIIDLESDIHSLDKRYCSIRDKHMELLVKKHKEFEDINNELNNKINELQSEITTLQNTVLSKPSQKNDIILPRPDKPKKPKLKEKKPEEPIYLVPNLFNKKKVLKENEILKIKYEEDLKKYTLKKTEYDKEMSKYKEVLSDYEKQIKTIELEESKLNKEEYNKQLITYEKENKNNIKKIEEKNNEVKYITNNFTTEKEKIFKKSETYQELEKIEYEVKYIISIVKQDIELITKLYSYGIIYGKYRNYETITTFYDYFMSGRCSSLEGPDGAYNLYEQEIRGNIVINKLDKIIDSLDTIKDNQYCIYNEITKINNSLDLINGQLLVNNALQVVEIDKLNKIIDNTNEIAYNTNVTAYYSKKISNYTKTMTFLKILEKL